MLTTGGDLIKEGFEKTYKRYSDGVTWLSDRKYKAMECTLMTMQRSQSPPDRLQLHRTVHGGMKKFTS